MCERGCSALSWCSCSHTPIPAWWTVSELSQAIDSPRVRSALAKLAADGVIQTDGARVQASRCVRHLDDLDLIDLEMPTNHDLGQAIRRLRRGGRGEHHGTACAANMSPTVCRPDRGKTASAQPSRRSSTLAQALEVSLPTLMHRPRGGRGRSGCARGAITYQGSARILTRSRSRFSSVLW